MVDACFVYNFSDELLIHAVQYGKAQNLTPVILLDRVILQKSAS
jgi:hypothetical protein